MHHGNIFCDGMDIAILSSMEGEHAATAPAGVSVQVWTHAVYVSCHFTPSEARDLAARLVLAAVAAENSEPALKVAA